jgi:protease IV
MHHIGEYKTAINQLTETGFTPAHREMAESLNNDMFAQLVRAVADGRRKSEAEVRALIDQGPFLPEAARSAGLVDEVAYRDQVEAKLAPKESEGRRIELEEYARVSPSSLGLNRGPRIAVIYASGTITSGGGGYDPMGSLIVGSDTLVDSIRRVRKDAAVKAVVVRIDSPGGAAVASDVIWRELVLAREAKPPRPLVASMSDLAASGGYYLAMAAPTIVAEPGTLTGSIGIFGGKVAIGGTYEKLGATIEAVSKGKNAEINSPIRPYNKDERAKVEEQLGKFYDQFVEKVAASRRLTPDRVDQIAQGRVWTGRQAREIGLVDELGGLERAIAIAKQQAKIPAATEVEIVTYPPRRSLYEFLTSQLGASDRGMGIAPWLSPAERRAVGAAAAPMTLFRKGEALALMPFVFAR